MKGNGRATWLYLLIIILLNFKTAIAQREKADTLKLEYSKIYKYCLDGDVNSALLLLSKDNQLLSQSDIEFKAKFESRFKDTVDKSGYLTNKTSPINSLLKIFHSYWRVSLLNNSLNYDSALFKNIYEFISTNYLTGRQFAYNTDTLDWYLNKYIQSLGLHTTGFGKTGRLYDLLVWRTERDTTYTFILNKEKISSRVILMDNFITLGWEEYATLDRYYPGGWATDTALYSVKKGYDLNSEGFLISYLAHESRHFADYKIFPKLSSADLEYRAKLTELSMAKKTLFKIISAFIGNSNSKSNNGHSIANFCVIRDLSRLLFNVDFEIDITKWERVGISKINKTANKLLRANTKQLLLNGATIEKYIKV